MTLCSKNLGGMPVKAPLTKPMAWVAEPFSKWRGQVHVEKKLLQNFLFLFRNCDVTSVEV